MEEVHCAGGVVLAVSGIFFVSDSFFAVITVSPAFSAGVSTSGKTAAISPKLNRAEQPYSMAVFFLVASKGFQNIDFCGLNRPITRKTREARKRIRKKYSIVC